VDGGFEVAAVGFVGIVGEAAAYFGGLRVAGEDSDAVPGFLAVPDGAVAGVVDLANREIFVRGF
jgi:hypothetical protein